MESSTTKREKWRRRSCPARILVCRDPGDANNAVVTAKKLCSQHVFRDLVMHDTITNDTQ